MEKARWPEKKKTEEAKYLGAANDAAILYATMSLSRR